MLRAAMLAEGVGGNGNDSCARVREGVKISACPTMIQSFLLISTLVRSLLLFAIYSASFTASRVFISSR